MYKYKSGQISITDFGQPMGMHLNENNRWVKKAAMIPWNEIEKRYAGLFKSHKGHPAKPLRLALGACMIQAEYGYSDEEITVFYASDLKYVGQNLDAGEVLDVITLPFPEVLRQCLSGEITDVKTIVGAFWLENFLKTQKKSE